MFIFSAIMGGAERRRYIYDAGILLAICLVFFYPLVVQDYSGFVQSDNKLGLAWQQFAALSMKGGELPYWDPYVYYSFYTMVTWLYYPLHLLLYPVYYLFSPGIEAILAVYVATIFIHYYLASFTMYSLLRHFELERSAAVFGAVIYTYNVYTLINGGIYNGYIRLIHYALMPLVFILILKLVRDRKYRVEWSLITGVLIGIIVLAGHIQPMAYYIPLMFFLVIWYTVKFQGHALWSREVAVNAALICVALVVAAGLSSVQAIPAVSMLEYTNREVLSFRGVMGLSMHPFYMAMAVLFPSFDSNSAVTSFVGGGYWEVVAFTGITAMIMAFLGLFSRQKYLQFFIVVLCFSFLVIMGMFIYTGYIQYDITKLLMRYPARGNIMFLFAVSFLAASGLEYVERVFGNKKGE